ncbi:MAG TPA: hypothetical protein VJZ93_03420 [Candidatus Nanoarchaeia archaeon]|nr:hypothetical protein [Candidatus Nanoarchaeia archaeon]
MNLKGIVIGIAIFILTTFVAVYGISVIFPQPEYNDFCSELKTAEYIDNPDRCVEVEGYWVVDNYPREVGGKNIEGYCDREYYCRQDYDNALEENSKKRFLTSIPVGIAIIVLGGVIFKLESVGVGLMAGGAGTFVWGAGGFWGYASDLWRFLISLMGLVVLIAFAYWFESKTKKGFFKKFFGKK